jgi:hypothetical protein
MEIPGIIIITKILHLGGHQTKLFQHFILIQLTWIQMEIYSWQLQAGQRKLTDKPGK